MSCPRARHRGSAGVSARRGDPPAPGLAAVVAQFARAGRIVGHRLAGSGHRRRGRRGSRLACRRARRHLAGRRTRPGRGWRWRGVCRRRCRHRVRRSRHRRVGLHARRLGLRRGRRGDRLTFTRWRRRGGRAGGLLGQRRGSDEKRCCCKDVAHVHVLLPRAPQHPSAKAIAEPRIGSIGRAMVGTGSADLAGSVLEAGPVSVTDECFTRHGWGFGK